MCDTVDFNKDNQPDILWRNYSTGQNVVWYMNGIKYVSTSYLKSGAIGWYIASTGDFNNDGNTDILWRNYTTGVNGYWLMEGAKYAGWVPIKTAVDPNWEILNKD